MNTLGNELAPKVYTEKMFTDSSPPPSHPHTQGVFVFVTVGGKKGPGQFLLAGNDEDVAALGPKSATDVNIALHSLINCLL